MNIRHPVHAGGFYEATAASCRHHATKLLDAADLPEEVPTALYGGLVPHAGWMYSGALAATTFKALAAAKMAADRDGGGTVVLFGADHRGTVRKGEVFDAGVWRTPLGEAQVDEALARAVLAADPGGGHLRANPDAHADEHSLEVQIPLVQLACPQAKILPIAVPPTDDAVEIGRTVGRVVADQAPHACIVGSTDLTHHGGHFGSPHGRGEEGVRWTEQNDRRMLDLIEAMDAAGVIAEAAARRNACGAGAVAAAIAACAELGATRGVCLAYTNSFRVMRRLYEDHRDDTTVGYASVVFA